MNTIDKMIAEAAKNQSKVKNYTWGQPPSKAITLALPGSVAYPVIRRELKGITGDPEYVIAIEYLANAGMDDDPLSFQPGKIVRARTDDHKCIVKHAADKGSAERIMRAAMIPREF